MTFRYRAMFDRLDHAGEGAFIPFVTLGDPDHETSAGILRTLIEAGADGLELGLPFSDPVADGPVIQAAAVRALAAGATLDSCLELVRSVRSIAPRLPIGLLGYANPVWRRGLERFTALVARAGADSILLADVPLAESGPFRAAAEADGVAPILIVPPNADPGRLAAIAAASRGYTYVTTRSGVTGDHGGPDPALVRRLAELRRLKAAPPVIGFGVSTPAQVRAGVAAGAAGVIAGSAVVRRIERHRTDPARLAAEIADFVGAMKAATRPARPAAPPPVATGRAPGYR